MVEFPAATIVHRRIPKEAFYRHLRLTKVLKEKFVSDVDRIVVENSLTKTTLNLAADSDVEEILLLSLVLKGRELDGKVLEAIARPNPHKLVFILRTGEDCQLALFYGKLYRTEWFPANEMHLQASGFTLAEIWAGLVEQIALRKEQPGPLAGLSIDDRLARQDKIEKLERLISKTEAAAWKEVQPKKQFELYSQLHKYKIQLQALNGENE